MQRSTRPSELISILSAPSHRFTTQPSVMVPVLKNQFTIVQLLPSRMPPPTISLSRQHSPQRNKATDLLLPLIVQPLPTIAPMFRAIVLLLLSIAPPCSNIVQPLRLIVQPLRPIVPLYRATVLLLPLTVPPYRATPPPCSNIVQPLRPIVPLYKATVRLPRTSNLKFRPTDLASALTAPHTVNISPRLATTSPLVATALIALRSLPSKTTATSDLRLAALAAIAPRLAPTAISNPRLASIVPTDPSDQVLQQDPQLTSAATTAQTLALMATLDPRLAASVTTAQLSAPTVTSDPQPTFLAATDPLSVSLEATARPLALMVTTDQLLTSRATTGPTFQSMEATALL